MELQGKKSVGAEREGLLLVRHQIGGGKVLSAVGSQALHQGGQRSHFGSAVFALPQMTVDVLALLLSDPSRYVPGEHMKVAMARTHVLTLRSSRRSEVNLGRPAARRNAARHR